MKQNVTLKILPHLTIKQRKEKIQINSLSDFYIIVHFMSR